jgi:hypothetical protein
VLDGFYNPKDLIRIIKRASRSEKREFNALDGDNVKRNCERFHTNNVMKQWMQQLKD